MFMFVDLPISFINRNSPANLEFALEQFRLLRQENKPVTLAAWNCVLSGAAERGDVDFVLRLWSGLERYDIVPNTESYSFVFESLGKNLRRREKFDTNRNDKVHMDACVSMADNYLSKMEAQNIAPTQHIVREYIEMLCLVQQVDTATTIVLESLRTGEESLISDKTIYRVASANAQLQQFEIARKLAESRRGSELIELLLSNMAGEKDLHNKAVGPTPAMTTNNHARTIERHDDS